MSSEKISFKVMVMFPEVLEEEIAEHNRFYGTDFRITNIVDDVLSFCTIEATQYQLRDIFDLGYGLSVNQYHKREKGELDW